MCKFLDYVISLWEISNQLYDLWQTTYTCLIIWFSVTHVTCLCFIHVYSVWASSYCGNFLYLTNSGPNFNSKAVTCLAYAASGSLLLSGSEDGMVRVWNANTHNIVRMFKHAKGYLTYKVPDYQSLGCFYVFFLSTSFFYINSD